MNEDRNTKQVIVFRRDLMKGEHSLRKGKIAAQVAHASLGALLKWAKRYTIEKPNERNENYIDFGFLDDSILDNWLNGIFTKICVMVENEEELLKLYDKIKEDGLIPVALITDAGNTEFHGVHTNTCIGIGPWWSDEIDEYTKDLPLF